MRNSEKSVADVDGVSCSKPEVDGEDMYCPEVLVPTLDLDDGSLACCPPHVADKLTVNILSELLAYEDDLPKNPNAETQVGWGWWGVWKGVKAVGKVGGVVVDILDRDEAAVGGDDISCVKSQMDGGNMHCPEALVPTLDVEEDSVYCCAPHVADKVTVKFLSDLLVYEDTLPENPNAETQVGHTVSGRRELWWRKLWKGAKAVGRGIDAVGSILDLDEAAVGVEGISCLEPKVDGEDMYCPAALVPTLDITEDSLVCCAPHDADKLTVSLLSELMVLEDDLPKNANAAEERVGWGWWNRIKKATVDAVTGLVPDYRRSEAAVGFDEAAVGGGISCQEPEMNDGKKVCPQSMVVTLVVPLDDVVCCTPHDANRLTVGYLSDLLAYEDQLYETPEGKITVESLVSCGPGYICPSSSEKAVGWGFLNPKNWVKATKKGAVAVGKHIIHRRIGRNEAAREVASVSLVDNNYITYPLALIGFVTLLYGAYAMGTSGKYEKISEAEEI